MELGEIVDSPPGMPAPPDDRANTQILAAITSLQASVASLVGKGGKGASKGLGSSQKGKSGGKDAYTKGGFKGDQKGPDKGKGKGGKARTGIPICREYARTGRCWHKETYGRCNFKHVDKLPAALSSLDDLKFEDIAASTTYKVSSDSFEYVEQGQSDKIKAQIRRKLPTLMLS